MCSSDLNPDKLNGRGYLNANAERSVSEGYKYVEVIQPDSTVIQYTLDKSDSTKLSPLKESKPKARYAVGFVNLIDPEDRKHWIAGTVITITDMRTDEVIARRQSYSFEPGLGSIAGFRSPWGFAVTCPRLLSWHERYPTRFFIDQILKPIQGV